MKFIPFKKLLIFSISFFVVFFGEIVVNIACGPEQDPYDYYVSFFHNNIQSDDYKPFAFNGLLFLNSEDDVVNELDVNSAEWANYLHVKKSDVKKMMYELDSASNIALERNLFNWNSKLPDSLKRNTFLIGLNKNKQALNYYKLVKQCESMISANYYSWKSTIVDTVFLLKNADKNLILIENLKDDFLKLRYSYQTQRMYRYGGNIQKSQMVYERYIANNPTKSAVKGWAMAQYAGSLRNQGKNAKAAYLFSKVFASNPEIRITAYRNYFWADATRSGALKFAKNDNEKANIFAINGLKKSNSDIQHAKDVYDCNPKNPLLAVLMIREVNKLEQNLLKRSEMAYDYFSAVTEDNWYYDKNNDSLKIANLKHLKTVRDFAATIANDKKYVEPDLGNITAAYLSWIENNDALATQYLKKVKPENLSTRLKDQYRITELLIRANQITKGSGFNENELLPALKWLDEKRFAENKIQPKSDEDFYTWNEGDKYSFTITARNFYQQILAPGYTKIGDTAKAALAMLKGDLKYKTLKKNASIAFTSYQTNIYWLQCLSEKTLEKIALYKVKSNLNDMESFLAKGLNQIKNDEFYELQGTSYLRVHQYANAIKCFNKLSANYKYWTPQSTKWLDDGKQIVTKLYANPFTESLVDYPKKYSLKPNGLTKKTFAKKMLKLQSLVKTDKKNAALYYYQMANGLYQTGEFGNSWFFVSYEWTIFINKKRAKFDYNSDYKFALQAKEYYTKAISLSNDINFRAKCTLMLARCEQKKIQYKYDALTWKDGKGYEQLAKEQKRVFKSMQIGNPYFKELRLKYSKTPFYQTASTECSYLGDFIAGK